MKRMLIAGALALAAMTGDKALAADLPQPAPPPPRAPATYVPTVAPAFSWSGFYLGINGGYGFGSSTWTGTLGGTTGSFNTTGWLIGGTLGANVQMNAFVLGVEGDGDWQNLKGSSAGGCGTLGSGIGGSLPVSTTCQTQSDWLATVRARAGVAFDRVLVFATGGAAFGNVQAGETPAPALATATTNSNTEIGWTVGGGVEIAFSEHWTAKVEYLYVDLGSKASCTTACNYNSGTVAAPITTTPNIGVSFTESLVRGGVNFKF